MTRDLSDQKFHFDEIDFSDETAWSTNSKVLLQVNRLEFIEILQQIMWNKTFKGYGEACKEDTYTEKIMCGFLTEFFTNLTQTVQVVPSKPANVTLLTPIYAAKVVIDFMQH